MHRAEVDFGSKDFFPVTIQKLCTDVFVSCVYMFMLKQKDKLNKQWSRNMNHQQSYSEYQLGYIC